MNNGNSPARLFLVGEVMAQVLADARRKLSGGGAEPPNVERIARRLRRGKAAVPAQPPPAKSNNITVAEALANILGGDAFQECIEEWERAKEYQELLKLAEEARRKRDASDEKRRG